MIDQRVITASVFLPGFWNGDSFQLSLQSLDVIADQHPAYLHSAIARLTDFCIRCEEYSQRIWRAKQLFDWLSNRKLSRFDEFKTLRELLAFSDVLTNQVEAAQRTDDAWRLRTPDEPDAALVVLPGESFLDSISIERKLRQGTEVHKWMGSPVYYKLPTLLREMRHATATSDFIRHLDALVEVSESALPFAMQLDAICDRIEAWEAHPSVRQWAAEIMPRLVQRASEYIFSGEGFSDYHLDQLVRCTMSEASTILAQLLRELPRTEVYDHAGSRSLYMFAEKLIPSLKAGECLDLLRYFVTAQDALVGGTCSVDKAAAAAIATSDRPPIGGIMWYLLAHPDTDIRWRAVHALRMMHHLGYAAAVDVVPWMNDGQSHPYCKDTNAFYWLAARQWFFLLIERLADELPHSIIDVKEVILQELASSPYSHAVILNFCRRAIAHFDNQCPLELTEDDRRLALKAISANVLADDDESSSGEREREGAPLRFHFDQMDTVPYWYASLAEVFVIPEHITNYVERVICDEWSHPKKADCTQAMYPRESYSAFSHRQGSMPRIERYKTYLELHAMHCAAVRLLASFPVKVNRWSDGCENCWDSWLSRWDLSAPPFWISDQRQATPLDPVCWTPPLNDEWLAAVTEEEFKDALGLSTSRHAGYLVVWGHLDRYQSRRSRDYSVSSALVASENAAALMRALQSSSPHDFRLPREGDDDMEILEDLGGIRLELRGWISDKQVGTSHLEESDPFFYRSSPTALSPGAEVKSHFELQGHPFAGVYFRRDVNEPIAFRETWCDKPDNVYGERSEYLTYGDRLYFRLSELCVFLNAKSCSLIFEAQVRRSVEEGTLIDIEDDAQSDGKYDSKSRIYVLDGSGTLTSCYGTFRIG